MGWRRTCERRPHSPAKFDDSVSWKGVDQEGQLVPKIHLILQQAGHTRAPSSPGPTLGHANTVVAIQLIKQNCVGVGARPCALALLGADHVDG